MLLFYNIKQLYLYIYLYWLQYCKIRSTKFFIYNKKIKSIGGYYTFYYKKNTLVFNKIFIYKLQASFNRIKKYKLTFEIFYFFKNFPIQMYGLQIFRVNLLWNFKKFLKIYLFLHFSSNLLQNFRRCSLCYKINVMY